MTDRRHNLTTHITRQSKQRQLKRKLRFESLEARRVMAVLTWDGGAGDDRWESASNWDSDTLPTAADDVVIDVANATKTIIIEAGAITVRSLNSPENLLVRSAGELTLAATTTGGISIVSGSLTVSPGRTLRTAGLGTQLTVVGNSTIDGASIFVSDGGVLSLPGVTSYTQTQPSETYVRLRATGAGSVLDLRNLTAIIGSSLHFTTMYVEALSGAKVDMRKVSSVVDPATGTTGSRATWFQSDGAGSLIDLSALTTIVDRSNALHNGNSNWPGQSVLYAFNSGTILVPALSSVTGTEIKVDATGTLNLPVLASATGGALGFGQTVSLPLLATIADSTLSIINASPTFPSLTAIDGASIFVSDGGVLSLPGVTSYTQTQPSETYVRLRATGAGSVLDLRNLTSIIGSSLNFTTMYVEALSGAKVDMRKVSSVVDPATGTTGSRATWFQSDGAGSLIDLSALTTIVDRSSALHNGNSNWPGQSTLYAFNSGTILVPALSSVTGTEIKVDATGTLNLPVLASATGGALGFGQTVSLPLLATIADSTLSIINASPTFPSLTAIDGASIFVSDGGVLSLPGVTSYTQTQPSETYVRLRATGAGSVLDLRNLTAIIGSSLHFTTMYVEALSGAKVDMRKVSSVVDPATGTTGSRATWFQSDGAGSLIDLSALTTIVDRSNALHNGNSNWPGQSVLYAFNSGTILVPALSSVTGTEIKVDATGTLNLPVLASATGGALGFGQTVSLPLLATIADSTLSIINASPTFPSLTAIDGASIFVSDGGVLSLPGVTSYTQTQPSETYVRLRATGAGSVLDLRNLTAIIGSSLNFTTMYVEALSGAKVDMRKVSSVVDPATGTTGSRATWFQSDGAGSLIDLSALTTIVDRSSALHNGNSNWPGQSTLYAFNSGTILVPALSSVTGTEIKVDATGTLNLPVLASATGGALGFGQTVSLPLLATIADSTLSIINASPTFPSLTAIDGASIFVSDGGVLSLPGVTSYTQTQPSETYVRLRATGAGSVLDLRNLTSIIGSSLNFTTMYVEALSGAKVDMRKVSSVVDPATGTTGSRATWFQSDGAGSLIDLSALTTIVDRSSALHNGNSNWPGQSTLYAFNSGTILVPALSSVTGTEIKVDATGTLNLPVLASATGGALGFGQTVSLPLLATIADSTLSIINASPTFPSLTAIDGASIFVSDGGVLSLPGVTSYTQTQPSETYVRLRATGAGSVLDLRNLTAIIGSSLHFTTMYVEALSGAKVDMRKVSSVVDPATGTTGSRATWFQSDGAGSLIDLSALTTIVDRSNALHNGNSNWPGQSVLYAFNSGTILVPALSSVTGTEIKVDATGTLNLPVLASATGGALGFGQTVSLPLLATIADSTLSIINASPTFPSLTAIDAASIFVSDGGVLSLPGVTSYTQTQSSETYVRLRATGAGSVLDLRNLTSIIGSSLNFTTMYVEALSGAKVDMRKVSSVVDPATGTTGSRATWFQSDGAGSLIDLSALTTIVDRSSALHNGNSNWPGQSTLYAFNSGTILVPALSSVTGTEIKVDATGTLNLPALASATESFLRFDRSVILPSLQTLSSTGITLATNVNLTLPVAQNVTLDGQTYAGAIAVPNLSQLTIHSGTYGLALPPTLQSIDLQSGELTVGSDAEVRGAFAWTGGTLRGNKSLTIGAGVDGKITGSANKVLAAHLINDGRLTYSGSSLTLGMSNEVGRLTNLSGQTLVTSGDGDISIAVANAAHRIINLGTWQRYGTGDTKVDVVVENNGSLSIQQGTLEIGAAANLNVGTQGTVNTLASARLILTGDLEAASVANDRWSTLGTTKVSGNTLQKIEVMSTNLGATNAGFTQNFSQRVLEVTGSNVRLVDQANNTPATGAEALYVDSLKVASGASLDLNGLPVFARSLVNEGLITGGSVSLIPDGGSLQLNSPAFGAIATVGEVDSWAFFGLLGQRVLVTVNPGNSTEPAAPAPNLNYATLELVAPGGAVVASATSSGAGQPVTIDVPSLSVDGNYTIRVRAPDDRPTLTGNYLLTGLDAKIDTYPLTLNQNVYGLIENGSSIDRWTFSALANQQVSLQIQNSSFVGLRFKLTGPNGYVGFSDLETNSELVTLPTTGTYRVEVDSSTGSYGPYAFSLRQSQETALSLSTPYAGSLQGEGFAQVFRVNVTQNNPLAFLLNSSVANDVEMYVSRGTAPTRQQFDFQSIAFGQTQSVVVPMAASGTWYALVYARSVANATPFTLLAESQSVIVQSVSPSKSAKNLPVNLRIQGAGFTPGTEVYLDIGGVQQVAATSVTLDASTQINASFDLSTLNPGLVDVRVRLPNGTTKTSVGGFEVLPPGTAMLETRLIMPEGLGRHAPATIYLEYANTGVVAMPAPLLTVRSADPDGSDRPLLTLDAAKIGAGFWTSALPEGLSPAVQVYAGGQNAGLLQPGERMQVPIYYGGLLTPWDFSDSAVELEVLVSSSDDNTTIDWPSLSSSLKPAWMSPTVWSVVFSNLQSQIGTTWGNYLEMLSANAQYLSRLGQRVVDASSLFGFELQQAIGYSPLSSIGQTVDMDVLAMGQDISFGRTFATSLAQRFETGPFGRGWVAAWQSKLTIENNGIIVISDAAGSQRRFQPDSRRAGVYFSSVDDEATLRQLPSGDFQLTEATLDSQTFSSAGQLLYRTDANGNRISTTYAAGKLTKLTHSGGAFINIAYNAAGRITTLTDSTGRVATYSYDATNEYLLSVTTVAGTTNYTYDTTSNNGRLHALTSIVDPSGVSLNYDWDNRGRIISTQVGNGVGTGRLLYAYDTTGIITTTNAADESTQVWIDHRGLVARRVQPDGTYINYSYDSARRLVKSTDALGRTQSTTYNRQGATTGITDSLGNTTTFLTTPSLIAPRALIDANGNRTSYDYDVNGNLVAKTSPNGTVERTVYDAQGNPIQLFNRRGQVMTRTYSPSGQVLIEQLSDGTTNTFTYDSRDRLASSTSAGGTTSFTYNAQDRLVRVDYPNSRWIEYLYDAAGRRLQLKASDGSTTNSTYDTSGRLVELRDKTNALIVHYSYDALNRVIREDKGNGSYTLTSYDLASRVASIMEYTSDNVLQGKFVYTYNLIDQRIGAETLDGAWTYAYDAAGQLLRAELVSTNPLVASHVYEYRYDALGNRTQTIVDGVTTAFSANSLNQITGAGATSYEYDADGNLIRINSPAGVSTYTYDPRSVLKSVTTPAGSWSYEYDAGGHRIAATVAGTRSEFLVDYSNSFHVVAEFNSAGAAVASYTYGYGLESVDQAGSRLFYSFDAIGSTSQLTGPTGNVTNRYVYEPYGATLFQSGTAANPFTFVGQFGVVSETNGLKFMQNRYYAASTGQFTTEDPIDLAGEDVNVRRYVGNQPVMQIDPDGTKPFDLTRFMNGGQSPGRRGDLVSRIIGEQIRKSREIGLGRQIQNSRRSYTKSTSGKDTSLKSTSANDLKSQENEPIESKQNEDVIYLPPLFVFVPGRITGGSSTGVANSVDPNEKFGAVGYGPQAFIAPSVEIPYRVMFENLGAGSVPVPTRPATAPAQRVEIRDQLSTLLDWSTLSFSEFGFGDTVVSLEGDRKYGFSTVPMTFNSQSFNVDVELDFNPVTGLVRVVFQSLDPLTELPPDILSGFLPPEDGTGRGKGYFVYNVRPKAGLATGTEIRNIATIIFDGQTAIATNQRDPQDPAAGTDPNKEALNTIDADKPTSSVGSLPPTSVATFQVNWSGSDGSGAGIQTFDIYVRDNGGSATLWRSSTNSTPAQFTGQAGHSYAFYSVATDGVGWVENAPVAADAFTSISNTTPTDIGLSQNSVIENVATAASVGTLSSVANGTGPFVYTLVAGEGAQDNAKFSVDGDTLKTSAVFDYEANASHSIRLRTTDPIGQYFEKVFTVSVVDLPELVGSIDIGDGSAQRSLVKQVTVVFDGAVVLAPGAFAISKRGSGGGSVNTLATPVVNANGQTVVTLTFSGIFTRGPLGALQDGYYQLTIDGSKISRSGRQLDINRDGVGGDSLVYGAAEADNFFALYGDTSGDGIVGIAEFGAFRSAFGKASTDAAYNPLFDFEADGVIGVSDFGQFRSRFGKPKQLFA